MKWNSDEVSWLPPGAQELVRFACTRMVHSYKPVLMSALLDQLPDLEFPFDNVASRFVAFYRERERRGLPVERRGSRFAANGRVDEADCVATARGVLGDVFADIQGCLELAQAQVRLLGASAWLPLGHDAARPCVGRLLDGAIAGFYERIELIGEAVYGRSEHNHTAGAHEMVFLLPDPDDRTDLFVLRQGD